ncbi:MAG: lamin tail domain-containing protein, partial [Planctomycetes bacterium]|nr:lamin tail domain-containing protein [Planctomycetota bacterium]
MKIRTRILVGISLCAAFSLGSAPADAQTVIINEIHYHPADGASSGEFVELYNYGERAVDIGGWLLSGAVTYVFPPETTIAADDYLVIARDADLLADRYDLERASLEGDFSGNLDNAGELLQLWTPSGYMVSFADYGESDSWPETPDGLGPSLERLSPDREETDPRAWAASNVIGGTPGEPNSVKITSVEAPRENRIALVARGAEFSFFRGTEAPPENWNGLDFDDEAWDSGPAGFGYGDEDDATVLEDMEGNYQSVFIRRRFEVTNLALAQQVILSVDYDDGFVAYLNGEEIARANMDATEFNSPTIVNHEAGVAEEFPVENVGLLREGENILAVQGNNTGLESSDFSLSPFLDIIEREEGEEEEEPNPEPAPRDLVVNELYMGGVGSGWIELYNPTAEAVDIGGRRIRLFPVEAGSCTFPEGLTLPPGARLVRLEKP